MNRKYLYIQIGIIASMYIVPYTLLSTSKGFELFLFWISTTLATGILSILYMRNLRSDQI